MESGTIITTIKGSALCGQWSVERAVTVDLIKLSPLITFDAFDKFKTLFRLKAESHPKQGETYYVQTNGVYGVLPEKFTIWVGRGPQFPAAVSFVPSSLWIKTGTDTYGQRGTAIQFEIELQDKDISKLYSPEYNFANIWKEPGADITLEASDGKQKNVHKTVLLARSDVFRAMWQNDMLESETNHLKIPELDENSLNLFESYLYHGTIEDCSLDECFTLLNIGDKYNIKHLVMKCRNKLQSKLSKDNVICIFLYADLHNLQNLKALTIEYALGNMEAIVLTKAWSETKNVSFFKRVCEDLVKTENSMVTVGKILQSIRLAKHSQKILFTIDAQRASGRLHQTIVSPESGNGTFIFRVSERDTQFFKLSVCQCKLDGDYLYTNVNFSGRARTCPQSNLQSNTPISWTPTKTTSPHIPEMVMNEWYDIALFSISKNRLTITLEMSYDYNYNPKNCAFLELLPDSNSADATLESSDGVFRQVHKSVLIARNLRAMVDQCDSKDHFKLCNISALALNEFINFIYVVNNEKLDVNYCAELLAVAHEYHLSTMKYECETKLKTLINTTTALQLLSLSVLNRALFLEQWVLDYFHSNKLEIIETENWTNFNDCNAVTVGKILQSIRLAKHSQKILFTIDAQRASGRLHQTIVSPESGNGTFIFRVSERDTQFFKLSVCQCKLDGDYLYTNVNFSGRARTCPQSNLKSNTPISWTPTKTTSPHIPEMVMSEWYDIALFSISKNRLTITLEMSYDYNYNPKNCAFLELLPDSNSAGVHHRTRNMNQNCHKPRFGVEPAYLRARYKTGQPTLVPNNELKTKAATYQIKNGVLCNVTTVIRCTLNECSVTLYLIVK